MVKLLQEELAGVVIKKVLTLGPLKDTVMIQFAWGLFFSKALHQLFKKRTL